MSEISLCSKQNLKSQYIKNHMLDVTQATNSIWVTVYTYSISYHMDDHEVWS